MSTPAYPQYLVQWEIEVDHQLSDDQKEAILHFTSSMFSNHVEVNYKFLSQCYYTPTRLHHAFPTLSLDRAAGCLAYSTTYCGPGWLYNPSGHQWQKPSIHYTLSA